MTALDRSRNSQKERREFEQKEAKVTKRDQDGLSGWSSDNIPARAREVFDGLDL